MDFGEYIMLPLLWILGNIFCCLCYGFWGEVVNGLIGRYYEDEKGV